MSDATLHMNLSEVRDNLGRDCSLNSTQKRDLISAVNTFAKWIELPLNKIPADRRRIRERLEELNHSQLGVSKKRFANVQSLVDGALDHGMVGHARKEAMPLSAEWEVLLSLVGDEWRRFKLIQLARYCSAQEIEPNAVTAKVFDDWLVWRADNAPLAKKPERAVVDARKCWNWCAENIESWPADAVPVPDKRKSILIPSTQLPVSLQEELDAFYRHSVRKSAEEEQVGGRRRYRRTCDQSDEGRLKPVTERVAKNRVTAICMCATELVKAGELALDELTSIADIVCADHAALMADGVIARTGRITEYPHSLVKSLRAVAAQWLDIDTAEIENFNALLAELGKDAGLGSLTPTNRQRLAQFANAQNIVRLVSLPDHVFADLEHERNRRHRVTVMMACRARTAIAIVMLNMLPVRRANLCGIVVGRHLVLGRTAADQSRLAFEAHEVKSKKAIGCTVQPDKERLIRLYLKYYRPKLFSADDGAGPLLVTQTGKAISGEAISADVVRTIRSETGLTVNIHLFRHVMGALILRAKPGQFDTVRSLLGHSKDSRVTALYAEIESSVAAEVLDEAIAHESKRRPVRKPIKRKWKRSDV